MHDEQRLVTTRKRVLAKGSYRLIEELAARGSREVDVAKACNVSLSTWVKIKQSDPKAEAALQAGRGKLYQALLGQILTPNLAGGGSVMERIALMKARHIGALATLNSTFGWRNPEPAPVANAVTISIAPAMSEQTYLAIAVKSGEAPNGSS